MANNGSTSANNRKRGNSGLMFVVCCFGFVGGLLLTGMGGLGFHFTLEGPGTYRFNGGDSQPSNPVRVKNAVCHVNQALDLGDECAVPVTEKPTTLKSYESVPLLFFIACHHTHGKSAPEPCTFVGNAYPMDVKDDTTQAKVKTSMLVRVSQMLSRPLSSVKKKT